MISLQCRNGITFICVATMQRTHLVTNALLSYDRTKNQGCGIDSAKLHSAPSCLCHSGNAKLSVCEDNTRCQESGFTFLWKILLGIIVRVRTSGKLCQTDKASEDFTIQLLCLMLARCVCAHEVCHSMLWPEFQNKRTGRTICNSEVNGRQAARPNVQLHWISLCCSLTRISVPHQRWTQWMSGCKGFSLGTLVVTRWLSWWFIFKQKVSASWGKLINHGVQH